MDDGMRLLLHNAVGIASVLVSLYVIFVVFLSDRRKTVNITFILVFIGVIVFLISHMLGVSVKDPELSRKILMWNIGVIFIAMFNVHCTMAALKLEKERRDIIIFSYVVGLALSVLYVVVPESFLLESVSKMYFPNYYVPGEYYWISRVIFQIIFPLYFIYEMIRVYRLTEEPMERNRIIYFAIALSLGWGLGVIPPLLIFNIKVDPLFGMFFPIAFAVPFTYAILNYELLDVRIVAKKAFAYALAIASIGGLITVFNFSSQWLGKAYPGFPFWLAPLISATIVVVSAVLVWRQLREGDVMKYEFITVVTHKFRTPLTHIRWAADNLSKMPLPSEAGEQVGHIQSANIKLVELTNLLVNASESETGYNEYNMELLDLSSLVREAVDSLLADSTGKKFEIIRNFSDGIRVRGDLGRMRFVVQVMLENAERYTPDGGTITVSLVRDGRGGIIFSVKDSGVGLSQNELSLVFSKFYRSSQAKLMDTEGMGIGLFISKAIITHHGGKIWIESEGRDKGTTVSFSLAEAS